MSVININNTHLGWNLSKNMQFLELHDAENSVVKIISCEVLDPLKAKTWTERLGLTSRITFINDQNQEVTLRVWNNSFGQILGFRGMAKEIRSQMKAAQEITRNNIDCLENLKKALALQKLTPSAITDIIKTLTTEIYQKDQKIIADANLRDEFDKPYFHQFYQFTGKDFKITALHNNSQYIKIELELKGFKSGFYLNRKDKKLYTSE